MKNMQTMREVINAIILTSLTGLRFSMVEARVRE